MSETAAGAVTEPLAPARAPAAFLVPSYKTPLMCGELLHAARETKLFAGVPFVLLLEMSDPFLPDYLHLTESLRASGFDAGHFVFDGTQYCGKVNRVAPILNAECVCVIDNLHIPLAGDVPFADAARAWLASSPQQMRVGVFTEGGSYPLVTRKLAERLGYLFHPLALGREPAEDWLLALGDALDIVSEIPGGKVIVSPAEGCEIIGDVSPEHDEWVRGTLEQMLDDEVERLGAYMLR